MTNTDMSLRKKAMRVISVVVRIYVIDEKAA